MSFANRPHSARGASASILLSWILGGCSLLGLADNLGGESCEAKDRSFCGELNAIEPTNDACMTWQCRVGQCVVDIRDDDGDRSPNSMCLPSDDPTADCDDSDPRNAPSGVEVCNGSDDDCDGWVDENASSIAQASLGTAIGTEGVEPVVYVVTPDTSELISLYGTPNAGTRLAMMRTDLGLMTPRHDAVQVLRGTSAVTANLRGLAASALGGGALVVGLIPTGCLRLVLGVASTAGSPTLTIDQTHFETGLAKLNGTCADDDTAVALPALGAVGRDVLAAWLTADDASAGARQCGAAEAASVLVAGAQLRNGALQIPDLTATSLGSSADWFGPSVLALDQSFLVAFVDEADHSIALHHVEVDDTGAIAHESIYRESVAGADARGEVHLARGPSCENCESPALTIALAWRQGGCGASSRVGIRFLTVQEGMSVTAADAPVVLDGEASAPRLAYADGRWAVAARRRDELVVAVLDDAGMALSAWATERTAMGGRPHAVAAGSAGTAFVSAGWSSGPDSGAFGGSRIGCTAVSE